jgi:hypothetical protein
MGRERNKDFEHVGTATTRNQMFEILAFGR